MNIVYTLISNKIVNIGIVQKFHFLDIERLNQYLNPSVIEFIEQYVDLTAITTTIIETSSRFNIDSIHHGTVNNFVNIRRINDIRYLNKYFETVNSKLPFNAIFIGCAETKNIRKEKILQRYPKFISYPYYTLDFLIKRVFPKWGPTRKIYFFLTRGNNRVLALPEILGRLISCGFEIVNYKKINKMLYFVVKKISDPLYDEEPSYGPLFKMKRVGKDRKTIFVYKLRTMHPYSEYLQQFIFENYRTINGDKPSEDFRITRWGRILRKLWIDELPMLVNLFKSDIKLVGVRPLSFHKFSMYPKYLQEKRIKYKPGLIPPFYADTPKTQEEFYRSEEKYLDQYEKNPLKTDVKYFFKALYNILIKRARSA